MNLTQKKTVNPLNFYKHPQEVDADNSLTKEEKIIILINWLDDIIQRQIAEAENMPPTHESFYHVAAIERLLREYGVKH